MVLLGNAVTGLAIGSAYSLLAVAVVLVFSGTKALSIAMGEVGAFALLLGLRWHTSGWLGWHPAPFAVALIAIVVGGLLGLVLERLVMRPLVGRAPLDNLIATLGIALSLALLELRLYGSSPVAAQSPTGNGRVRVLGATLQSSQVASLLLAAAVAVGLYLFLSRTSFGLSMRAATSDPGVSRLLGVRVNSVYRFAWVVGGALSGAAAALLTGTGQIVPFQMTTYALSALAGAVIGGLDSYWGAIAGSLLVGVVEAVVGPHLGDDVKTGSILLLVLVVLVVRPRGLLGKEVAV